MISVRGFQFPFSKICIYNPSPVCKGNRKSGSDDLNTEAGAVGISKGLVKLCTASVRC